MIYTIDTTVLAKGIIPPRRRKKDDIYEEQLRLHKIAKSIIREVEAKQSVMHIPSVAIVEMAAVGARLTGKSERGVQSAEYVRENGNIVYDINLLSEAIRVASQTKISGFDSIFIACTKITNSTLITDDKKMYNAAVKTGVNAKLLREMKV